MDDEKQDPDIIIEIAANVEDIDIDLPDLQNLAKNICSRFELKKTTVNIAIVDDTEIIKINKQFLNRQNSTDVISFDLSDEQTNNTKTFDLIVNAQRAKTQAHQRGHSTQAELALYITHGLLHNLGFDDLDEKNAKKMHQTEDEILKKHGFGIVYNSKEKIAD